MRTLVKFLIALTGLLLSAGIAHGEPASLTFGVLNQQSPALTAERWNPILHYLSIQSGVPLQLRMGRTVQETDAMMGRGDFDFVFTNHNFQSDFDAVAFKVLARWAGEPIRAVIAVPADSPVHYSPGAPRQARVVPLLGCLRGLRGAARGPEAGRGPGRGGLRRQPGRHPRPAQGPPRGGGRGQLALPHPVRRARAGGVPADLRLGRLPGPRGDRAPPRSRRHRRSGSGARCWAWRPIRPPRPC